MMRPPCYLAAMAAALAAAVGAAAEGQPAPRAPDAKAPGMKTVRIASRLQAKRGAVGRHDLAVVFDAPKGDGRRGAKGVVVNSGMLWEKLGTRWALRYARGGSAYGLQVIHPFKEGQVIIRITKSNVAAATPRAWTQVGYHGGYFRRLTSTDAFKDEFPLEEDKFAAIVSTLRPDGSYELAVNGHVVAQGKFSAAKPLSFEIKKGARFPGASGWAKLEFKGNDFPEQWGAGYAGILVEPLDNGQNTVTNLRFAPGLIRLKTDENTDF